MFERRELALNLMILDRNKGFAFATFIMSGWGAEFMAKYGASDDVWICHVCSVRNKKSAPQCASCEAVNPSVKQSAKKTAPAAAGGDPFASVGAAADPFASVGSSAAPAADPFASVGTAAAADPFAAVGAAAAPAAADPFAAAGASASSAAAPDPFAGVGATTSAPDPFAAVPEALSGPKVPPEAFFDAPLPTGQPAPLQRPLLDRVQHAALWASEAEPTQRPVRRAVRKSTAAQAAVGPRRSRRASLGRKAAIEAEAAASKAASKPELADAAVRKQAASLEARRSVEGLQHMAGGDVWTWGSGECEQLGHGDEEYEVLKPKHLQTLKELASAPIVQIAVGGLHTLALDASGAVWSWGCNDDGALGRDGEESVPAQVTGPMKDRKVVRIACGDCHSLCLGASGEVFVWGCYKGSTGNLGFAPGVKVQREPLELAEVMKEHGPIVRISCGANHTAAVTQKGRLLMWGCGEQGQLGRPVAQASLRGNRHKTLSLRVLPTKVAARDGGTGRRRPAKVANVWCGGFSTFVRTREGAVLSCGLNNYGQLGHGDNEDRMRFTELPADAVGGDQVVEASIGQHHTLLLTASGTVWGCGRGDSGQLGLGSITGKQPPPGAACYAPRQVPAERFGFDPVVSISAGSHSSLGLTDSGRLFVWGYGENGQLGNDADEDSLVPLNVTAANEGAFGSHRVLAAGMGGQHVVALVSCDEAPAAVAPVDDDADDDGDDAAMVSSPAPAGAAAAAGDAAASGFAQAHSGRTPAAKRTRRD